MTPVVFPYRCGNGRFIRVSGFRERVEEPSLTLSLRIRPGGARLNFWIAEDSLGTGRFSSFGPAITHTEPHSQTPYAHHILDTVLYGDRDDWAKC